MNGKGIGVIIVIVLIIVLLVTTFISVITENNSLGYMKFSTILFLIITGLSFFIRVFGNSSGNDNAQK